MEACGVMAEHPELWTDRTPGLQPLFERVQTFGLAREAERLPPVTPPDLTPTPVGKARRERGPFLTYLQLPWSYGNRTTADRWHGMKCRRGRHHMGGGHTVQMGGTVVFLERQCRWCGVGERGTSSDGPQPR